MNKSHKYDLETDIAIIGAGPAGSTTSIALSKAGVRHVIFDKATFPRDKVCGDAFSGKVVQIFKKLDPSILEGIYREESKFLGSWGITFVAPNGKSLHIPFKLDGGLNTGNKGKEPPPGFISRRYDFDNYLVGRLDPDSADMRFGANVVGFEHLDHGILINYRQNGGHGTCLARLVIGAGGDRSIVAKKLAGHKMEPEHYCAGVRAYYENVDGLHEQNFIELHFLRELLPGYFWIFPLPNNLVNVGVGMRSAKARKKEVNIKKAMLHTIHEHPDIKDRFKNAIPQGEIKGWGLPLGSKRRNLSGNRFMLVGDAASLIDPFTGEGIGNAMASGIIAADIAKEAWQQRDFSSEFLREYDEVVYKELWGELKLSRTLQKLAELPWLFNFLVNKARKNQSIRDIISCMFEDLDLRTKLRSPGFYLRLLVN
ncbi:MAG: geranylgeranyl reductase family protein [bacterium]